MNRRPSPRAAVSIAIAILVIFAVAYVILTTPSPAKLSSLPSRFVVNGKSFSITYTATNESAWEAGLMNKKITNTTTMLFIFPTPAAYSFWMHDVNSSLDIIWVSVTGNVGHVVYLVNGVPGCSLALGCPDYTPSSPANYVIEAKSGFADANGVGVGTTIQFG